MQRYLSHKIVEAAPIRAAEFQADGSGKVAINVSGDLHSGVIEVPAGFASRGVPAEGDYLVRYSDGYLSWSPKAAFEEGYRPAGESLTFGTAIEALKAGHRVARSGWNGKGMWLALSGPLQGRAIAFENFWSKPCSEYARLNGGSATVLPCINMKTATGEILMGWLASQSDIFSEDWQIIG